jgi:hypothetical protein
MNIDPVTGLREEWVHAARFADQSAIADSVYAGQSSK